MNSLLEPYVCLHGKNFRHKGKRYKVDIKECRAIYPYPHIKIFGYVEDLDAPLYCLIDLNCEWAMEEILPKLEKLKNN